MESIQIYNEDGSVNCGMFEVVSNSTGTKNVIKIRDIETGKERLIHKDRVFQVEQRRMEMEKKSDEKAVKKNTKKAKKKKPLEKFDIKQLDGIIFKKDEEGSMKVENEEFSVKSYWRVSGDATKWKHFNLYNDSLGRKNRLPEFSDNDNVKMEFSGDLDAIEKHLNKKGYKKIN